MTSRAHAPVAVTHHLAHDVALGCLNRPLAVRCLGDRHDFGVAVDLGAGVARPDGQRLGHVGRGDVAVVGVEQCTHQAVGLTQRPQLGDLLGPDHLEGDADGVGGSAVLAVLVHALSVGGQAQVAGPVEAHRLAGLGLEPLVEVDRVLVQLADRVAHVEQRQQPGGVPGRAVGEVGFLDQHRIRPPQLGEVIKDAAADDTTADHHRPGMAAHGAPLRPRGSPSWGRRRGPRPRWPRPGRRRGARR